MAKGDLAIMKIKAPWKVSFSKKALGPDEVGCWQEYEDASSVIFLKATLTPICLYRTYLHEVAHGYGLDHFGTGLMSPGRTPIDFLERMPTSAERAKWVHQLAKMIEGRRPLR